MLAGLDELAVPGKVKESNSFVRVVRRRKVRTAFLVFPLRIPAPDSLATIDIVGPLFEGSQLNSSGGGLRPHRWNFPSKKLPRLRSVCVLAFELIGNPKNGRGRQR